MLRSIAAVLSATTLSQVLLIISSPLLSRLYTPVDFGIYIFTMTVVAVISPLVMLRLENAIVVAEIPHIAGLKKVCLFLSILWFLISFVFVAFFGDEIISLSGQKNEVLFAYFIPPILTLTCLTNVTLNMAIVKASFKCIGKNKVIISISTILSQIILGFWGVGANGLLLGALLGMLLGVAYMWSFMKCEPKEEIDLSSIYAMLKKYSNFPKFDVPSSLFNLLSLQLPNLSLGKLTNSQILGYFSFTSRVMLMPINLISQSVGVVFKKQAIVAKKEGSIRKLFFKVSFSLFVLGLIPFSLLLFFGAEIFEFVFGNAWKESGVYATILVPMLFFKFIVSPVSFVLYIFEKQKLDMLLQLAYLLSTTISIILLWRGIDIIQMLYIYSLGGSLIYILYWIVCFRLTEGK
ncbi:oligosaccharide flippase family protein [Vibrio sp. 10N.261.55.A7]|uniref:lipopolysaccharide biosynthesis protein n=1 Tax=Vibrio sp. 10N.261.55.A7 TaxID=1880851 RepID=UPI000C868178|nr:oligosaccharide flippase family protein [Vibrio sp. 10N.261.55.A7]PMK05032.1 hypothetical protein BCU12_02075 [Vibrio sp. 10N.261.55.A7]